MANEVARIDQNDRPTMLAYDESTSTIEKVRCDAVFDYLEIYIAGSNSDTFTTVGSAKIDENDNCTLLGYNETTGLVEALRGDSDGSLLVTFV